MDQSVDEDDSDWFQGWPDGEDATEVKGLLKLDTGWNYLSATLTLTTISGESGEDAGRRRYHIRDIMDAFVYHIRKDKARRRLQSLGRKSPAIYNACGAVDGLV